MKDVLDAIIYYDELSEEQQVAVRAALEDNPEYLQLFSRWQQLKTELRARLDASLPDRELLVLYALQQQKDTYLTPHEHDLVAGSSQDIEEAMQRHPALGEVVADIGDAQRDFLNVWQEATGEETARRSITPIFSLAAYRSLNSRIMRVAAVFLVGTLALFSAYTVWQKQQIEIVRTAANDFQTVHFEDGSSVRLIGDSELTYLKSGILHRFDRSVKLDGQAFFDITPSTRPFTVESATAFTEATGTQFSIEATPENTEIILTNGEVTVNSKHVPGQPVTLSPGQRSRVARNQPPSVPEVLSDLTEQLSWTGLLVFHYSPLESVVSHLASYFDAEIEVAPALKAEAFKASFDPDTLSLSEALETLTLAFDATVDTVNQNSYLLTPYPAE